MAAIEITYLAIDFDVFWYEESNSSHRKCVYLVDIPIFKIKHIFYVLWSFFAHEYEKKQIISVVFFSLYYYKQYIAGGF